MEVQFLRYTLRIDILYFQKFRYIEESEGRSANKEIEQYIKTRVDELESIYDEMDVEPINPFRVEK